jgi:hypothetical protein
VSADDMLANLAPTEALPDVMEEMYMLVRSLGAIRKMHKFDDLNKHQRTYINEHGIDQRMMAAASPEMRAMVQQVFGISEQDLNSVVMSAMLHIKEHGLRWRYDRPRQLVGRHRHKNAGLATRRRMSEALSVGTVLPC